MADIEVDLPLLRETAGGLGVLLHEFERAADIVEDAEPAIGRNALLQEMRAFAGEWRCNRQKLLTSIQAVYEAATESHDAYVQVDDELARSIQTATEECRP